MSLIAFQRFLQEKGEVESKPREAPIPIWNGPEYKRVRPGRYSAVAVRVQGPEWLRQYRRWSLLVEFELLGESDPVRLVAFFNMGDDRQVRNPRRQSRFFKAWVLANGELPRKGQPMDPKIFMDGQVYEIEVADCSADSDEGQKTDGEIYSKVTKVHSAHWPNRAVQNL